MQFSPLSAVDFSKLTWEKKNISVWSKYIRIDEKNQTESHFTSVISQNTIEKVKKTGVLEFGVIFF